MDFESMQSKFVSHLDQIKEIYDEIYIESEPQFDEMFQSIA